MMPHAPGRHVFVLAVMTLAAVHAAAQTADRTVHWPQFRGPNAAGLGSGDAPVRWNVPKGEAVLWKTPIPGLGHSSVVIWGDRAFVTTAVSGRKDADLKVGLYGNIAPVEDDTAHIWRVYCLDKRTGAILWERVAHEGAPIVKRHTKATHANSTPATDGRHVVAFFGSEGLHCYDVDGDLRWRSDFGTLDSGYYAVPEAQWGFGSSPIIHDGLVIVQCDVQGQSFLAALDVTDGKELWRTPRDEVPTWGTPTVYFADGAARIAVNGYKHIGGYDLKTGKEVWRMKGGGDIPVPTPVVADGLLYITNAHGGPAPVYAIRTAAAGDITLAPDARRHEHIAWRRERGGAYMQTPLIYGDHLYICTDNGIVSCLDARTGEILYGQRLGAGRTGFTASSIAAGGNLYFTSEEGDVYVVKPGTDFEVLSVNALGEVCMSTPAFSEGVLYFRTQGHVVAISSKTAPSP